MRSWEEHQTLRLRLRLRSGPAGLFEGKYRGVEWWRRRDVCSVVEERWKMSGILYSICEEFEQDRC